MVASRMIILAALVALGACSSKTPAADTTPEPTTATSTPTTSAGDDASAGAETAVEETAVEDVAAAETQDELARKLELLGALEISGMTRSRSQVQRDMVTVQFDTAPNAKGNAAAVELTVNVCERCTTVTVEELEGRKEMMMQQLGELHAKNPGLLFEVKPFELAPQRAATMVYARSYIDDGTTRASVHTLEVNFADSGFSFRFQSYPRSGFPTSAEELASAFSQAELEAATRQVFAAAADVLWPPSKPE